MSELEDAKKIIKHEFYPPYTFSTEYGKKLYKNMIVRRGMVEEPFHSIFVKLLEIQERCNESYLKNYKLESVYLQQNDSEIEIYKAYLLHEMVLYATTELAKDIRLNLLLAKDYEVSLLTSLLNFIELHPNLESWFKNYDGMQEDKNSFLAKLILNNYKYKQDVLNMLEEVRLEYTENSTAQTIQFYYDEALDMIEEYVQDSTKVTNSYLSMSFLNQEAPKILISKEEYIVFCDDF